MTTEQDDLKFLRDLPSDWWKNPDAVDLVEELLDRYDLIQDPLWFREKPWKYKPAVRSLHFTLEGGGIAT